MINKKGPSESPGPLTIQMNMHYPPARELLCSTATATAANFEAKEI